MALSLARVQPLGRSARNLALSVAVLAVAGALVSRRVAAARRGARSAEALAASVARGDTLLRVPHIAGGITLDGDTDDPGWVHAPGPARTGAFLVENGRPARPYSETRVVWGGDYLYLALYASDEDIETHTDRPDAPNGLDDAFRVVFSQGDVDYAIEVTPSAVITDSTRKGDGAWNFAWSSGVHVSREIDGSMNDPKNMDEEWAIEMAIPFASLGMKGEPGENIAMTLTRCDTPKRSPRVCAGWGEAQDGHGRGRIVLE